MQSSFIKLVIVGDTNVGKTSLVNRYVEDTFGDTVANTVGVDFLACKMDLFGQTYTVQLWDTAGQERFRSVVKCYFKSALGVLLVFDVTSRQSFDHIVEWLGDIDDNIGESTTKVIVGNKADLEDERVISYDEGRSFAESRKMMYFETSAKSAFGVDILFESIVKTIVEENNLKQQIQTPDSPVKQIKLSENSESPRKGQQGKPKKCCDF